MRKFGDRRIEIIALLAQPLGFGAATLNRNPALFYPAIAQIVEIDHLLDLGQAEADVLGAENPREPRPIALGIDPRQSDPRRRDQALILIESQRPCGDVKLGGQVRNRKLLTLQRIGRVEVSDVMARWGCAVVVHSNLW